MDDDFHVKNNVVMSEVVADEYSALFDQMCWIKSSSIGFVRFEELIIHTTQLIPPNAQHELLHEYLALVFDVKAALQRTLHDFLFVGLFSGTNFHQ